MHKKIISLFCLALILALAPVGFYPAGAAPQTGPLPARERGEGGGYAPAGATDYLSIPAQAFLPLSTDYNYSIDGRYLKSEGGDVAFIAPVYLPHGATIKRISSCFYDDANNLTGHLALYTTHMSDYWSIEMGRTASITGLTPGLVQDSTIDLPLIDNSDSNYWVELNLPSPGQGVKVWSCGVYIEYTRPETETGLLSIPASPAFKPFADGYNAGKTQIRSRLIHYTTDTGAITGTYLAQVSLPQGAVVNKVTAYYEDQDLANNLHLYLVRQVGGTAQTLADIQSVTGLTESSDTLISNATVDNYNYSYYAYVNLPASTLDPFFGFKIEYTLPAKDGGKLAISAAAMSGFNEGSDYANHGRWFFHLHSEGGGAETGQYGAAVHLPQGARVDTVWFSFWDKSVANNGSAYLVRYKPGGYPEPMAGTTSSGSGGYVTMNDPSIEHAIIDNSQYTYFVNWDLPVSTTTEPPDNTDVLGVKILVVYTPLSYAYLPVVSK